LTSKHNCTSSYRTEDNDANDDNDNDKNNVTKITFVTFPTITVECNLEI